MVARGVARRRHGLTVHDLFALLEMTPEQRPALGDMVRFPIDQTFF